MHITIPVNGALSGKLVDNLKDQLEKLQQAQSIINSIGLTLDIRLGDPEIEGFRSTAGFEVSDDAPSPELADINEIEEHLEWFFRDHNKGLARRGPREFVLAHLGYFREMEPKLRETVVCYYAPSESEALSLSKAAVLLGVSSSTVNSRLFTALRKIEQKLEALRNAYISQLTADAVGEEPVAVLELGVSERTALRDAGFKSVSDVARSSRAELRERLRWEDVYTEKRKVEAINGALHNWNLALAG